MKHLLRILLLVALSMSSGISAPTTPIKNGVLNGTTTVPEDATITISGTLDGTAPTALLGTAAADATTKADAAEAAAIAASQPLDTDLTSIAALSTTSFGLSLLEKADAAALRTTASLVIGTDVQGWSANLDTWATYTPEGAPLSDEASAADAVVAAAAALDATTKVAAEATARTAAITAAVAPVAASRAPVDYSYIDGQATDRRMYQALGSAGNIVGSPITEGPHFFRVPTVNPSNDRIIWAHANATAINPAWVYTLVCYLRIGSPDLIVRANAAGGQNRYFIYSGFRSAYSGQMVGITTTLTPGNGNPNVWLWTESAGWFDATASFSPSASGAAFDWLSTGSLTATYRTLGLNFEASEFRAGPLVNRAWTQTDVDYYARHNRVPPVAELTGTMQLLTAEQSGFEAGVGGWSASGEASVASYDHAADPDGIGSAHGGSKSLKVTIAAGSGAYSKGANCPVNLPATLQVVDVEAWVYVPSGSASVALILANGAGWVQNGTTINSGSIVDQWTKITLSGVVRGSASNGTIRIGGSYGVTAGSIAYVDDVKITVRGIIAATDIGWTAQARGRYNRIHATITPGITPMPVRDAEVQVIDYEMSATGYLLGTTGPHVFRDHKIDRIEVMPTTATIPTITLRRNATSGGTPLVNAISAGTQGAWSSLAITGGTADGAAGDYYHITLGSAANVRLRITLSKR